MRTSRILLTFILPLAVAVPGSLRADSSSASIRSQRKLEVAEQSAGALIANWEQDSSSWNGKEVLITGELVGAGDQVLELRVAQSDLKFSVNSARSHYVGSVQNQQVKVYGVVEQIDLEKRRITIRAFEVWGSEAPHAH